MEKYIQSYKNDGFVVIPGIEFLTVEEHSELLSISKEHTSNIDKIDRWRFNSNGTPNKIEGACDFEPKFLHLAKNPYLVKFAQSISKIGEDVDCYISKFFPQTKGGESTLWHQDNYYFNGNSEDIVSCAIYLTDTSKENGCLRVAKKSHIGGKILEHNVESGIKGIRWIKESVINEYEIVDLIHKGPYAVFFDINIAHGCYQNQTHKNRYSLAWEYISSYNNDVWKDDLHPQCDRNKVT